MRLARILAFYRVRPGYWFRPKAFGWGAVPVTWQGWVATIAFATVAVWIAKAAEARGPLWLLLLVPVLIGFLALVWAKTDGPWRFRWGGD